MIWPRMPGTPAGPTAEGYLAKVLIIDEMGCLPLDDTGPTIFFQFVSTRYEWGRIILASNTRYDD